MTFVSFRDVSVFESWMPKATICTLYRMKAGLQRYTSFRKDRMLGSTRSNCPKEKTTVEENQSVSARQQKKKILA
jgi:hypothetical protein